MKKFHLEVLASWMENGESRQRNLIDALIDVSNEKVAVEEAQKIISKEIFPRNYSEEVKLKIKVTVSQPILSEEIYFPFNGKFPRLNHVTKQEPITRFSFVKNGIK